MSEQMIDAALIEHVAIAIWGDDDPENLWADQNEVTKETYRMEARAAIRAIREWDARKGHSV